jgi:hypothetical protein
LKCEVTPGVIGWSGFTSLTGTLPCVRSAAHYFLFRAPNDRPVPSQTQSCGRFPVYHSVLPTTITVGIVAIIPPYNYHITSFPPSEVQLEDVTPDQESPRARQSQFQVRWRHPSSYQKWSCPLLVPQFTRCYWLNDR